MALRVGWEGRRSVAECLRVFERGLRKAGALLSVGTLDILSSP